MVSHEVIVNLIANTATGQGLTIQAELDKGTYPTGIKITDKKLATVNLIPAGFHGEWNYTIAAHVRFEVKYKILLAVNFPVIFQFWKITA